MKNKFLLLVYIFFFTSCFSQEGEEKKTNNKRISLNSSFSVGLIYPIEFGTTALAKGHSSNVGLTTSLGLVEFSNFTFGIGLDYIFYSVEDKQLIGNYGSSKHNSYFMFLNYDYPISKKLSLNPIFGYGYSELVIKKSGKRRGAQDGNEMRIGTSFNYNFNDNNVLCFSILYVNNRYVVNTTESLKDFFEKSNSIQIGIIYKTK